MSCTCSSCSLGVIQSVLPSHALLNGIYMHYSSLSSLVLPIIQVVVRSIIMRPRKYSIQYLMNNVIIDFW